MGSRRVRLDNLLHESDLVSPSTGGPDRRGELSLATGSAKTQNQPASNRFRNFGAVVVLDESQGKVDACAHPGGGPHLPRTPDKHRIRINPDLWIALRQFVGERPVGGRLAAVEQTGLRDEERPGADADNPACVFRGLAKPRHQGRIRGGLPHSDASGDHHCVDLLGIGQWARHQPQPGARRHRLTVDRGEHDLVTFELPRLVVDEPRSAGEGFEGADDVQGLDAGEPDDCYCLHVIQLQPRR